MRVVVELPNGTEAEFDWKPPPRKGEFVSIEPPSEHEGEYVVAAITWIVDGDDYYPYLTLSPG